MPVVLGEVDVLKSLLLLPELLMLVKAHLVLMFEVEVLIKTLILLDEATILIHRIVFGFSLF
jgi:hypothetical protein